MTKTHFGKSALLALCLIFALTLPAASAEEDWDLPTSEPGGDIIIDDLWDTPCIAEPYDEIYEDSYRSIKIKRIEWDNSVAFIADVQLKDAGDFHAGSAGGGFDTISVMAQQGARCLPSTPMITARITTASSSATAAASAPTARRDIWWLSCPTAHWRWLVTTVATMPKQSLSDWRRKT